MKDNYVADIGDFGKYALLRHLTGTSSPAGRPPSLGVIWYLTEHTEENNDGRHTAYLDSPDHYRPLDPELFDHLRGIIDRARAHERRSDDGSTPRSAAEVERLGLLPAAGSTPRCVAEVERLGLLPATGRFFAAPVAGRTPPQHTRAARRAAWWSQATEAVQGADLVFLDPDNGLFPGGMTTSKKDADKAADPGEVGSLLRAGQAVVLYHHLDRTKGGWDVRRPQLLRAIRQAAGTAADRASVLRLAAFSSRAFILVTPPGHAHADHLHRAHATFLDRAWRAKRMRNRVHLDESDIALWDVG